MSSMQDEVKNYYGEVLKSSGDLQTDACCTDTAMPDYLKTVLAQLHDEVLSRYYGCGLVAPEQLRGMRILDLGSGSGRDCYALAALVGEEGFVVGVDMTDEQLAVANRHIDFHREQFGYPRSNVEFRKGYIEKLDELGYADDSFDIIVSNCVINLSPDKEAVLRQAYRLLKPGGEIYFSDVYADRRVPASLAADPVLYGECLGGALYWNDFLNIAKRLGFIDPRLVDSRRLGIDNPAIREKLADMRFYSATYRLFKLDSLEPSSEDYGQTVTYLGTVDHHPERFDLDADNRLEKGRATPVCGNTYRLLKESRFREHFQFSDSSGAHRGPFEKKGAQSPIKDTVETKSSGCCG